MNASQEHARRRVIAAIAWLSWIGATLIAAAVVTENLGRPFTAATVVLVGAGIAAGQALGRARLAETMTMVFLAGMKAEREHHDDNPGQGVDSSGE